ncbi:MAG: CcdB family protein [Pseudomonadota bacterium]
MARFEVFVDPTGEGYLLDVQADVLDGFNTRIVVPLLPASTAPAPSRRLNPVFEIQGATYVMVTQFMGAVPVSILREPVATLKDQDTEVTSALDMAFFGF